MNLIAEIDNRVIRMVQEVYLWLLDRTGVYVGTLIFAFGAIDNFCLGLTFFRFVMLALIGVWSAGRYLAQATDLRRLNRFARNFADTWFRVPITVVLAGSLTFEVCQLNWWRVTAHASFFCWLYLACIQVRDREPKDFLPSLKPVGARS